MKKDVKIFCVGFNKTGTTSLHGLFRSIGLKSYHGMYSDIANKHDFTNPIFRRYDSFTDGEYHDFEALDKAFPGSKFILTTRRLDKWLMSRIKHVHYRKNIGKTGWMREEYERNPDRAVQYWISRRKEYYKNIREYFKDRKNDYLELNICDGDESQNIHALTSFLNIKGGEKLKFPRENVHNERTNPTLLKKLLLRFWGRKEFTFDLDAYKKQIDTAFQELDITEDDKASDQ